MSCESCRTDGEQDGRTWLFPDGPRSTTNLRGLAPTHPLHWSADRDEVQDFEFTIRELQGCKVGYDMNFSPSLGSWHARQRDRLYHSRNGNMQLLYNPQREIC